MESLKQEEEKLKKQISLTEESLLSEDDPDCEKAWKDKLEAEKEQLEKIQGRIKKKMEDDIQNFVKRAGGVRFKSDKSERRDFQIAKKDAEDRLFFVITMSPEQIAQCFSTDDNILDPWGGPVNVSKYVHSWFHDLRKRENNIIPLSPGVKTPTKKDIKSGQLKEVQFLISHFYTDNRFIKRCAEYFNSYGIELTIRKDKKINRKWWIKLKVMQDVIYFNNLKENDNTNQECIQNVLDQGEEQEEES